MQENYELVQRGFRILVGSMSSYIGQTLNKIYGDEWWNELLSTLQYPKDLPTKGTYDELVDSLDIANCLRIIDWMWGPVFRNHLTPSSRAWSKELMGLRNSVAHYGQQDLDQPMAERGLDTMALLCAEIDHDGAEEIRKIYREVRARASDAIRPTTVLRYAELPESASKRGALKEGSLLNIPASAWTHTVLEHNLVKYLTAYIPIEPKVGLIGRDDVVNKVRTMLDSHKNIALVSGIGGIGKTAVMAQICNDIITEDRKDTYVAWITCGESYIDDFLCLRQALGIPEELKCEVAYKEVIGKLRKLNGTIYLFLDDMGRMPDRKELGMYNTLRPNVRIMITSRHEIKGIPHVDLQELKKDSAIKMFYDYYGRDKEQKYVSDAWWIIKSDSVRSHTQLVELLAKAANVFYGRLPEFRRKLEEKGYLDVSHRRFDSGRFANNTIKEIVIQLYNVSDLSEEQQRIMRLFSIFTAEKVIYGAVEEWAGFDEDTVDGLARLGWLVRAENGFIIRQIIKDSLVEQVGENLKIEDYGDLLNRVIDTNEYMPRDLEYSEVQERLVLTVDVARYLWTRVEGFLENENHSEEYKELFMSSGVLFNNIAGVFRAQADYEKALEYYGKALAISERVLGTEHPDTATTYNDTGRVYYCQDDYARALEYYMKALSIRERVLGSDHPDTAATYNNMALVYDAQGDYEMALEYYVKALSIREQVLGMEHPDTAMTYNNMVSLLRVQVDYEKALVIVEKVLDPEWPSTVMTYNKMAGVYENMGHYPKALACYAKALSISERVLGPEHPSTATAYNNMAVVYYKRGDFKNSLKYFEKALAVRKMKLGINHPNTQNTMKWIDKAKTEVHTISEMYKYRG